MRTNIYSLISFVLRSKKRKKVVRTILEYPKRQWSCSSLEEVTKISHATVYRTLQSLQDFGLLKSVKINKKDILYELVRGSPWIKELEKIFNIEKTVARNIAKSLTQKIKQKPIRTIILYGSSVKGDMKPGSDIDVLVIINKHDTKIEENIHNKAAELSSKVNKTVSVTILDTQELQKEKNSHFIVSVKANMEVLYGKPF